MKSFVAGLGLLLMTMVGALAGNDSYDVKDITGKILHFSVFACPSTTTCPLSVPVDASGFPLFGIAGTTNPNGNVALFVQGVTGGLPIAAILSGTLPAFAATPTFNCGTGCFPAPTAAPLPVSSIGTGQADNSLPINISTGATVQIVPASGSLAVYITGWDVIAGGTGNFTLVYGTGSNCGTGQQPLTGAYPLVAQAGIARGSGNGTILKAPAGSAICAINSAAVQMSGSISFRQF